MIVPYCCLSVFLSIQRRQVEQIKVALPIILNAVKAASFDLDDRVTSFKDLFEGAISIANSIIGTCKKLVCQSLTYLFHHKNLCFLLGLLSIFLIFKFDYCLDQ